MGATRPFIEPVGRGVINNDELANPQFPPGYLGLEEEQLQTPDLNDDFLNDFLNDEFYPEGSTQGNVEQQRLQIENTLVLYCIQNQVLPEQYRNNPYLEYLGVRFIDDPVGEEDGFLRVILPQGMFLSQGEDRSELQIIDTTTGDVAIAFDVKAYSGRPIWYVVY